MRRVYVKEPFCMGCGLCEVYCQLEHAQADDLVKVFKRESPRPVPRLCMEDRGVVSFSLRCQQCDEAPCVAACITGALNRDPVTGQIRADEEQCVGCWTCLLVCPFGVIRQDKDRGKALRCDLCQGEEIPACVANCPNEALVYLEVADSQHDRTDRATSPVK
jgi:carbon-monoxide dehydrogenase iron sulfur subunit